MHALIRTSVPLLEAAAAACRGLLAGDPAAGLLAGYFTAHAAEERGHDRWLLEDLAALGVRRPDTLPGPACAQDIAALAGAQYYWIHHGHPACLLGYIAVLEGCPPDAGMVAGLPARTGLPAAGFRTLAWHASQDPAHSRELALLLEWLPLTGDGRRSGRPQRRLDGGAGRGRAAPAGEAGMTCAACHGDVPGGARFCPACGVQVASAAPRRGLRKTVTILFCDMTGSTVLSGRLDAESLHEVMFRYYALMRECLERHGGTVEKFIGDAVVAVFGVPVVREDDARRALRAAAEMLEAVESLNLDLRAQLGIEIGVRIGVNTGEVVASEDASSGQALAAGEPVNVAARLQTAARPGEILIGPVTRELAGSDAVLAAVR